MCKTNLKPKANNIKNEKKNINIGLGKITCKRIQI